MPIKSAELSERFRFDRRRDTATDSPPGDEFGNYDGAWLEQFNLAAKLHFLRGGEAVMESRLKGHQPAILTIRASNQSRLITTDWRAVNVRTGDQYNIRSISPDPDRASIDLLIERGVNPG